MKRILGVVFDLDGVIIESEHLWEESWRAFAESEGSSWSHDDTLTVQGMSTPEWSRYLARHVGRLDAAAEVTAFCVGAMISRIENGDSELIDGARELVEAASASVPIALASSAPRRAIDAVLDHHGLASLFSATVSSEEVPRGKPSPDVYLEALARLGLAPDDGLAVEDSSNGLRAAHAAGLIVVAIPNPTYPPSSDALELAEHVAVDHDDARRFVLAAVSTETAPTKEYL